MVIGHDHIDPEFICESNLTVRCRPAVGRDQQSDTFLGQDLDGRLIETIALSQAMRNIRSDFSAKAAEE
jgi:hypothetical protein